MDMSTIFIDFDMAEIRSSLTDSEIYELFLLLQSFDELKRSIIMVLCHIYPKRITSAELSDLAGYSKKSKYIFKSNVLESLLIEKIITVEEENRKKLIQIDEDFLLLVKFANLCNLKGKSVQEQLLAKLLYEDE